MIKIIVIILVDTHDARSTVLCLCVVGVTVKCGVTLCGVD